MFLFEMRARASTELVKKTVADAELKRQLRLSAAREEGRDAIEQAANNERARSEPLALE